MVGEDGRSVFCRRLKEARKAAGLSQKKLGMQAGLDEFVASTRINRYEVGVHDPDLGMAARLAEVLAVPLAYFFAGDDRLAQMVLQFSELAVDEQEDVLAYMAGVAAKTK